MHRLWIGFVPYAVVSAIHITALAAGAEAIAGPTKLLLMPFLAVAVFWGGRGSRWGTVVHAALRRDRAVVARRRSGHPLPDGARPCR